jgi:heat-inducible transcriptional repressor
MLSEATGLLSILWLTRPARSVQQRGLSRLLAQPEFHDAQALVPLMELIERATTLGFFFERALQDVRFRVLVGIGEAPAPKTPVAQEATEVSQTNNIPGVEGVLSPFSLVAERLATSNPAGVIAVFGPTRMDYRTVIPAVSLAARVIGGPAAGI